MLFLKFNALFHKHLFTFLDFCIIAFGFTRCKRYWPMQLILAQLSTKHLTCWFSTLTSTKYLSIVDVNLRSGFLSVMHDKRAYLSFLQHHPFWIMRGAKILCLFYSDLKGILKLKGLFVSILLTSIEYSC